MSLMVAAIVNSALSFACEARPAGSARKMISFPWRYRRVQIVHFGVSGHLSEHFGVLAWSWPEDELLQGSTGLTSQVCELTEKVRGLTWRVSATGE
jgi:hypothetical protein